jgi:hypothetical protein
MGYENLFSSQMHLGRLDDAGRSRAALTASVERRGPAHMQRWVLVDGVREHFARGDWDEAMTLADAFLAGVDAGSPHYLEPPCRALRAAILLVRGDHEAAAAESERAVDAGRRAKDIQVLAPALCARAAALAAVGRRDEAVELAAELLEGSHVWNLMEWGCLPDFACVAVDLGLALDLADAPASQWTHAAAAIVEGDLDRADETLAAMGSRRRLTGGQRLHA